MKYLRRSFIILWVVLVEAWKYPWKQDLYIHDVDGDWYVSTEA